jgi:hypothetical protein
LGCWPRCAAPCSAYAAAPSCASRADSLFGAQCLFELSDSPNAKDRRVHWKKRRKQIQYLQLKHGNDRSLAREFPVLEGGAADSTVLKRHAGQHCSSRSTAWHEAVPCRPLSQTRAGVDYTRHGLAMDGGQEVITLEGDLRGRKGLPDQQGQKGIKERLARPAKCMSSWARRRLAAAKVRPWFRWFVQPARLTEPAVLPRVKRRGCAFASGNNQRGPTTTWVICTAQRRGVSNCATCPHHALLA